MSISWRWAGAKAVRQALLYGALVFAFYRIVAGLVGVPLHVDEFVYIHHSNWLNELRQGEGSVYQVSGDTLRDPPVTPYLIGLSLRAGGYPDAPAYWVDFGAIRGQHLTRAALPEPPRLWMIRFPTAALFFLTIALTAALVMRAAGFWAGLLTILALAGSEYLLTHLRRAMTEGPMLFFLLALMTAGAQAWQTLREGSAGRAALWAGTLGVLAGLGIASKHNAAVNLAPLGVWITVAALGAQRGWTERWSRALALGLLACVCALGTFIALTPILGREPLRRVGMMLAERQDLISRQQQAANGGLATIAQRIEASARRTLNTYAPLNCSAPRGQQIVWDAGQGEYRWQVIGAPNLLVSTAFCAPMVGWVTPLVLLNVALIAPGGWRLWRVKRRAEAATLITYGVVNITTAALLIPLDWDRYYLLPVFFATVLIAVGVAQTGQWIGTSITQGRNTLCRR